MENEKVEGGKGKCIMRRWNCKLTFSLEKPELLSSLSPPLTAEKEPLQVEVGKEQEPSAPPTPVKDGEVTVEEKQLLLVEEGKKQEQLLVGEEKQELLAPPMLVKDGEEQEQLLPVGKEKAGELNE